MFEEVRHDRQFGFGSVRALDCDLTHLRGVSVALRVGMEAIAEIPEGVLPLRAPAVATDRAAAALTNDPRGQSIPPPLLRPALQHSFGHAGIGVPQARKVGPRLRVAADRVQRIEIGDDRFVEIETRGSCSHTVDPRGKKSGRPVVHDRVKGVTVMAEWVKKIEENTKGLIAEAEQELTALEGADTVDLTADDSDDTVHNANPETVTTDDAREQVSD